ncbi:hypothetical protein [Staphylococcus epidermidis]|uniref:hypothetical protein n=1 Tax=Staphylococcus epidermidis TaxID=1282 RepID=UPI0011A94905|nr:hypothetical protein [Staphylococcus epidermidis]
MDKFGKDRIWKKGERFNRDEGDEYVIEMIGIDNIWLRRDGKSKGNRKDNDVYREIKALLIGD